MAYKVFDLTVRSSSPIIGVCRTKRVLGEVEARGYRYNYILSIASSPPPNVTPSTFVVSPTLPPIVLWHIFDPSMTILQNPYSHISTPMAAAVVNAKLSKRREFRQIRDSGTILRRCVHIFLIVQPPSYAPSPFPLKIRTNSSFFSKVN